jgi:putative tRNA adenosine deaminase-associated protein
MSYFSAVLTRNGGRWQGHDVSIEDCESLTDLGDLLGDFSGAVRLLVIEQDDEFAAIVRLDASEDEPRAFLSDGHAADSYPLAALIADDLAAIAPQEPTEDDEDVPPVHESAPFGDAEIVEDLGTSPSDLIAMCVHQGTLPVDVLVAVCEKAGCAEQFEDLRG